MLENIIANLSQIVGFIVYKPRPIYAQRLRTFFELRLLTAARFHVIRRAVEELQGVL